MVNKKALQYILKDKQHSHQWHRSCCWCPIACSWLCQHLWMCLLPLALPCVVFMQSHSLHPHLPCRNAAKHKLPCGSCVFRVRYSSEMSVFAVSHLLATPVTLQPAPLHARTSFCCIFLTLPFPPGWLSTGWFLVALVIFYSATQFLHKKVAFVNKISFMAATSVLSYGTWTEKVHFAEKRDSRVQLFLLFILIQRPPGFPVAIDTPLGLVACSGCSRCPWLSPGITAAAVRRSPFSMS